MDPNTYKGFQLYGVSVLCDCEPSIQALPCSLLGSQVCVVGVQQQPHSSFDLMLLKPDKAG